jgi:hypothetical protein
MNTWTTPTVVLAVLVAAGMLIGTAQPSSAEEHLVGGYAEVAVTNAQVVTAAEFAVKTLAAMPERTVAISLVEILSAQRQVVAGTNYRLRIKVKVDGAEKEVEVVVWRKLSGEHNLTSRTWK